ncbi:MAG: succinylglutamate desuccinylase/aspartoacylase family protein [Rhodospirillaceae bacterium]
MTVRRPVVELRAPDLGVCCAGNSGIDYVTAFDSGRPGPHVLINALCHGNELCGALAVERLIAHGLRPLRGRLTLCLANVAAFLHFDPARPLASRCVAEDFNRLWSEEVLGGGRDSVELRRARTLRPLYERADILLDLHSMTNPGEPLALCGRTGRARALALALGFPRWVIADSGHAAGRRLIEFGAFARSDAEAGPGGKVALLIECGQHWEAAAAEVAFAVSLRLLLHTGLIAPACAAPLMPVLEAPTQPVRLVEVTDVVTAEGDGFVFVADYTGMETVPRAGTIIGHDQGRPVRTPHDDCILIMPARTVLRGQTVVRLGREIVSERRESLLSSLK